MQIPKAQKDTDDITVFFTFSGSGGVKALCKTLVKLTPDRLMRQQSKKLWVSKSFVNDDFKI